MCLYRCFSMRTSVVCRHTRVFTGLKTSRRQPINSTVQRFKSEFSQLLKKTNLSPKSGSKISVVGCGQVGITVCAFLLLRNLVRDLVIFDVRKDWVNAEALDLLHGSCFINNPRVSTCTDGSRTKDSDIIIITAGARPSGKDRSRLAVVNKTAKILESIVPILVKNSPKAVYIVVSNPADIMTYVVQRLGKLEKHQCFTTGCHLETARFRYLIAKRLEVSTSSVQGFVIGEHGTSAVPVWSSVTVGGVPLLRMLPKIGTKDDKEKWAEAFEAGVLRGAAAVSTVKGYTNWAISLAIVDVVEAMQENSGRVLAVGTDARGINCIEDNVVLSLPCIVTSKGISHILQLPLTDTEQRLLLKSAEVVMKGQCSLEIKV